MATFCFVFLDLSCVEFIDLVELRISCNVPMTVESESEKFFKKHPTIEKVMNVIFSTGIVCKFCY